MSTPNGEPMISADYESSERLCCQDAIAVAADSKAVETCLTEYMVRQMFEHGIAAGLMTALQLVLRAETNAVIEYTAAPIIKGSKNV